jgi:tartrate-resistant acid phosphatase type 5
LKKWATESAAARKLVIGLGDNFYTDGVYGLKDRRFSLTFEDVYCKDTPALQTKNMWRNVAGNHDYHQNVTAQLLYTDVSEPWYFPSEFYTFTEAFLPEVGSIDKPMTIQFIMCDTMILCAGTHHKCPSGANFLFRREEHFWWLEQQLNESTADYLVVTGHHPVWSMADHGNTQILVDRMRPLLIKYNVTAYLSGHDHCAQAFRQDGVDYHTVGGGRFLKHRFARSRGVPAAPERLFYYRSAIWPINWFEGSWATMEVSADHLVIKHLDSHGKQLFRLAKGPRDVPSKLVGCVEDGNCSSPA